MGQEGVTESESMCYDTTWRACSAVFTICTRTIDCWQKVLASLMNSCSQCGDHAGEAACSRDTWVQPSLQHKIRSWCSIDSWSRTQSGRDEVNSYVPIMLRAAVDALQCLDSHKGHECGQAAWREGLATPEKSGPITNQDLPC